MNHQRLAWLCIGLLLAVVIGLVHPIAGAPTALETVRVSVDSSGMQSNNASLGSAISVNGRFVVFSSSATNLVPNDNNDKVDLFLHDRRTGHTTLLVVGLSGAQANRASYASGFADGDRYVTFYSFASNLVPNDTNDQPDAFIIDRYSHETTRASVSSSGEEGNGGSGGLASADGRYVAFGSSATNLVPNDTNGREDVFIHDRHTGETTRVSVNSQGVQGNSYSYVNDISADGRFVVFDSDANNLVPGDTARCLDFSTPVTCRDVFVHDRQTGQTTRVSVTSSGEEADNHSGLGQISADGRYVAFSSNANNLYVVPDSGQMGGVFVHDRQTGETQAVSINSHGEPANSWSGWATISADGRFVAFESFASNLVEGDTNEEIDVFVHDRQTGETTRISVTSSAAEAHGSSRTPQISSDGYTVVFESWASDLVPGDTNGYRDIFVRRWREPSNWTYLAVVQRSEK